MTTSIVMPVWAFNPHARDLARGVAVNIRETTPEPHELVMVYAGEDPQDIPGMCDRFIAINPPQGWAAASNIGLLHATGEYLVVGSSDIRVPAGWLPALIEAAGDDAIASPLDYKRDGKTRRHWDQTMRGSFWGGWFLFPRRILDTIGYLDGYTMRRLADMDWAVRARKAGFRTVRADVKARHIEPHHTNNAHPDPHDNLVRDAFAARHEGADRFGSWEA